MTGKDKVDLVNVLTIFEGICGRRHNKNGFRKCNGCPFYNKLFRGCLFYSVLDGMKTHKIDLMKLKYGKDPHGK